MGATARLKQKRLIYAPIDLCVFDQPPEQQLAGARYVCTLRAPGLHRDARASSYAVCPNPMSRKLKASVKWTDFVFFSAMFKSSRRSIDRKACAGPFVDELLRGLFGRS